MAKAKRKKDPRGKKLDWDKVGKIRQGRIDGVSTADLAKKFDVDVSTVRSVLAERSWKGKRPSPLKGRKTGRAPANKSAAPADDWSDKVRRAKNTPNQKGDLSIEQYNACYKAYQEKQSAQHVAKEVGISAKTAAKYIKEGDPGRNLRPLRDRFDAVLEQAHDRQDYDLARSRLETQNIARGLLMKAASKVQSLDAADIKPFLLPKIIKDMQVVIERTLGVADATVKVESEDRFAKWSIEELMSFVSTGTAPEHDIMAKVVKK